MDEFKGAIMQLMKTKQLEEKQFARLADVANLLKLEVEKRWFFKFFQKIFNLKKVRRTGRLHNLRLPRNFAQ